MTQLGAFIRQRRERLLKEDRSFSQLQVSKKIGIEQSYLSKIERGAATKLSEEKLLALAEILNVDPDFMLALGGKVSSDVLGIIQQRPRVFSRLVRQMKNMPEDVIEADQAFKQRQSRVNSLYDLASIGFFHISENPESSSWSKLTPEILSLPEDALPSVAAIKESLDSASLELFSSLEQESVRKLASYECELRLKKTGGGARFVKLWGDSEYLPDEDSVIRIGLVQDVTQEVSSREELKKAYMALDGTVEDQSEQLDQGIQRLKKEIAARRLLEAELHEVNNDIRRQRDIKKAYLRQSAYELRTLINRLAIKGGEGAASSSLLSHVSAAINNLYDYGDIEAGVSPILGAFEPGPFFENLMSDIRSENTKTDLNVNLEISPRLPDCLVGDQQRLQQVVHPVIAYLINTTLWGSVHLTVDYLQDKESLSLSLSSTTAEESIQKEFFYPALLREEKPSEHWMLATVGPIVEGLGGELFVDQTPSRETIVTIHLPSRVHEEKSPPVIKDLPLLVVEDDDSSRIYSERIIETLGYEVESVALGQDALDRLGSKQYGVIVLDIQLPDVDGVSIARSIRKKGGLNSGAKIIAVTAHTTFEDRHRFEEAGIDHFLAKPYKFQALAKIIESCFCT